MSEHTAAVLSARMNHIAIDEATQKRQAAADQATAQTARVA